MTFKEILERKIKYYGNTEAAYEFAAEEYSNKLIKEAQAQQLILSGVSSMLILTPKDAEVFFNEIMNPKEANKALKKAMLKFITR
ncbi:MAG: hypothetical protein ACJA2M_000789 [Polaribacter sp.]|jgi:hypothetical protein